MSAVQPRTCTQRPLWRWALLCISIVAVIVVPFVLFGDAIDLWTVTRLRSVSERPRWVALVLGLVLASDVILPVPSSVASTASGAVLGWWRGTLVSVVGMTVASGIGYLVGRSAGRSAASRLLGQRELRRLERLVERYGDWMIVCVRSVPVLAETSTFFAGMSCMPFSRFLLLSVLSNAGISLVYAVIGVYAVHRNASLLAFAGAILVPTLALVLLRCTADPSCPKASSNG